MGMDLTTIGNHNIRFRHRQYKHVLQEILERLNSIEFPNAKYLRLRRLHEVAHSSHRATSVREINMRKTWETTPASEYYFHKYKNIDFNGPFGLSLSIYPGSLIYDNPWVRYWQWFNTKHWDGYTEMINEWRKYFFCIQHALGGDSVVYTGDCGLHFDRYYDPKLSFEQYIEILQNKYEQKYSFSDVANDIDHTFLVDLLDDIDWNMHYPLDEYLRDEPNDKDNIDWNIEKFKTPLQLFDVDFDDNFFSHKKIDGNIHYFRLLRFQGIIVKHTGIVGTLGTVESSLDEYATFAFEKHEKQLKEEGYHDDLNKDYILYFRSHRYEDVWSDGLEVLYSLIEWYGVGERGGGCWGERIAEHWLRIVDEDLFLKYVRFIRCYFKIKLPMEIYKYNEEERRELVFKFSEVEREDINEHVHIPCYEELAKDVEYIREYYEANE